MASHPAYANHPAETDSGAFFKVAALLLGIAVGILGFFALLLWTDARDARGEAGTAAAAEQPATDDHNTAQPINSFAGIGSVSPEATTFTNTSPSAYVQVKWPNTVSNRLLLEGGVSRNMMNWNNQPQPGGGEGVISVTERRTNLT